MIILIFVSLRIQSIMTMVNKNPLYEELSTIQVELDLANLAISLSGLSPDHAMIVQSLIIHHRHLEGGCEALPYGGSLLTKTRGAKYDLNQMPTKLRQILMAYVIKVTF